jgi:soluble cytochrome b562
VSVGLVENEFNYSLLRREGFRAMAALVDAVDGHRLEHGDLDAAIDALERISDGTTG